MIELRELSGFESFDLTYLALSDQILPPYPSSMNQMPIKRKRGRPRKEKGLHLLASPVPVHPSLRAPCVLVQTDNQLYCLQLILTKEKLQQKLINQRSMEMQMAKIWSDR
ncbi:hypothetical protein Droror1_Dr00020721 [Drosera rotundifolia]